jgi:DNA adenine methylase
MTGVPESNAGGHCCACMAHNIGHLYEIYRPANLIGRFKLVDLEALSDPNLSKENPEPYTPVSGPIPYIGGKNRIANQIIEIFPEHTTYVEAFAGGAQVLFHKEPSRVEILNDLDGEVVNFFRVCQSHHEELLRCLRFILVSRRTFAWLKSTSPEGLTDIHRAARFFYLLKNSFAALVRNPNYHHSVAQPPSFNVTKIPELIEAAHKRLARVQIESLPYQAVLQRYDRPTTLFYLDPPYFDRKLYRFNFSDRDFEELEHRLRTLRGKFVLSLNDVPEVRKLFSKFRFKEIALHYTSQREAGKRYPELLITNFRLGRKRVN